MPIDAKWLACGQKEGVMRPDNTFRKVWYKNGQRTAENASKGRSDQDSWGK